MGPELMAEGVLFAGLVLYALFGGADFGGGIWTALASGPRAIRQRKALFHAIGPVWETNHVWLIFVVVTLFTAFPAGFAALCIALMTPLVLALVGINFRGAAFAFRHFSGDTGGRVPVSARAFEIASILTPFTLGMAVTATAAGGIKVSGDDVLAGVGAWVNPFTVMGGLVGMGICAYLAPVYMAARVSGELQEDFRKRGMVAGIALGVVTAAYVPVAKIWAPLFAHRLLGSLPLTAVSLAVVGGSLTQLLLWKKRFLFAQIGSGATVVFTFAGFALALHPDLLIGELPFTAAAAPRATLVAYLSVLPVGALILIPSLLYLYWTFRGEPDPEIPPQGEEE